jgi:formamidopyrimidine-DNA glycosylase
MPELPEVEVVRRGLHAAVTGGVVRSVEVRDERALKRHVGPALDFVDRLEGEVLGEARRRGKFLWVPMSGGAALVAHLGMSGQLLARPVGAVDERQLRVRIRLERGGADRELRFIDQRLFGSLAIDRLCVAGDDDVLPTQVAHIARDPLDPLFDEPAVIDRMRASTRGVKSVLLDQGIVSGVGNIYADEALWRARLHWARPAASISRAKVWELLGHVRDVFLDALAEGGTSFDALYVNVNGESGTSQTDVYARHGMPCTRCGATIVREKFMGRSSHFCPVCQRKR